MRTSLLLLVLATLALVYPTRAAESPPGKPNIVVIHVDHSGAKDGCPPE